MRVHKLTVKGPDQPCGLHACLRHTLRLARWAGTFPVQGLGKTSVNKIRFKIKCVYGCYFIATLIGQVLISCFSILSLFQNEVNLNTISETTFYIMELMSAILLLKLSQQWPKLIAKAAETEQSLTGFKLDKKNVVQANVIAYVAMASAAAQHILSMSLNIKLEMSCLQETEITSNVIENHVVHWLPHVFNYVPYSAFSAFLFQYISLQTSFLWNLSDVIIICLSIYFTAYFRILNEVIASNVKKDKDTIPWGILRVHHSNLVKLVKEIDAHISSFILIAFFTDLYYICLQLFNSLHRNHIGFNYCDEIQIIQELRSPWYLLFYLSSFAFFVLRTLMLSLFVSNIHCASLDLVYSIYDLPSSVYDIEVVGTIITYEIVLLQYYLSPETCSNDTTVATIVENVTNIYGKN